MTAVNIIERSNAQLKHRKLNSFALTVLQSLIIRNHLTNSSKEIKVHISIKTWTNLNMVLWYEMIYPALIYIITYMETQSTYCIIVHGNMAY